MDTSSATDCARCRELEQRIAELERQVAKLTAALEEARRAGLRQAAPFRKPKQSGPPKKPGRKPGEQYGEHQRRALPAPGTIDETYEAPLPLVCPQCGSKDIQETHVASQYQTEIPRRPLYREFHVHRGQCQGCGAKLQGRHELQTSDALGAAASQLGPDTHAAIAIANKTLGLSHGKIKALLGEIFGLDLCRSTSCRSVLRTAARCQGPHQAIRDCVRGSPWVVADETGWRIGGETAWLHAFVSPEATCYVIEPTRSHRPAQDLLGLEWSGRLVHDGWAPYERFKKALHQQCNQHLIRRCRAILETATRGAVRFPRAVLKLIEQGFAIRRLFRTGEIDEDTQTFSGLSLSLKLEQLVQGQFRCPANRRLADHLARHSHQWFLYLIFPELDATNYRAEQALRPAVVNRKVWGGNRTARGAWAQSILMSVCRTLGQTGQSVIQFLHQTLCRQNPTLRFAER